jgi:hypothetical protein
MSKRLIVNADDYGRTSAVSAGIRAAHQYGIITSATVMANMQGIAIDLRAAMHDTPRLGLGAHLTLTSGRPVLPAGHVNTFVDEKGHFFDLPVFTERLGQIDPAQVKAEWQAQMDFFTSVTGKPPDHIDSHHHVSYYNPELFRAMLELARDYDCAIRLPLASGTMISGGLPAELYDNFAGFAPRLVQEYNPRRTDYFTAVFFGEMATKALLLETLASLPEGVTEIMSHPGYADTGLISGSSYARQRVMELSVLTNPDVKDYIASANIELISFGDL